MSALPPPTFHVLLPSLLTATDPDPDPHTCLLMLPGLGGNGLCFPENFVRKMQHATGAGVTIRVTYGLPIPGTAVEVAAQVWTGVHATVPTCTRFILAGYSMGGFIAQAMAATCTGLAPLYIILMSSAFPSKRRLPIPSTEIFKFVSGGAHLSRTWSPKWSPESRMRQRLRGLFPAAWVATLDSAKVKALTTVVQLGRASKAVRKAQLDIVAHFLIGGATSTIHSMDHVHILCLHGVQDAVLDVRALQATVADFPANKTVVLFPGAGHGLLYQVEDGVVHQVKRWMEAFPPPLGPAVEDAHVVLSPFASVVLGA